MIEKQNLTFFKIGVFIIHPSIHILFFYISLLLILVHSSSSSIFFASFALLVVFVPFRRLSSNQKKITKMPPFSLSSIPKPLNISCACIWHFADLRASRSSPIRTFSAISVWSTSRWQLQKTKHNFHSLSLPFYCCNFAFPVWHSIGPVFGNVGAEGKRARGNPFGGKTGAAGANHSADIPAAKSQNSLL